MGQVRRVKGLSIVVTFVLFMLAQQLSQYLKQEGKLPFESHLGGTPSGPWMVSGGTETAGPGTTNSHLMRTTAVDTWTFRQGSGDLHLRETLPDFPFS